MILTQDFQADFDTLAAVLHPEYSGPPIAFVRAGDGEYAILRGMVHKAKSDGWEWGGERHDLQQPLFYSLTAGCEMENYYVGISGANHHPNAHTWYLRQLATYDVPMSTVTFASLFIFANYERFRGIDLSHCHVVSWGYSRSSWPPGGFSVPRCPNDPNWQSEMDVFVDRMLRFKSTILVSAGPWASVLIYRYWKLTEDNPSRQSIIDVGSAIDERLRGRKTRRYQHKNEQMRQWVPKWSE